MKSTHQKNKDDKINKKNIGSKFTHPSYFMGFLILLNRLCGSLMSKQTITHTIKSQGSLINTKRMPSHSFFISCKIQKKSDSELLLGKKYRLSNLDNNKSHLLLV